MVKVTRSVSHPAALTLSNVDTPANVVSDN